MYQLNNLRRNVLITPKEVIFHAPVDHTFDERKIENSIIIAEERFIRKALSWNFYEAFAAEKNTVVTLANLTDLQSKSNGQNSPYIETLKEGDVVNASEFLSADNKKLWDFVLCKLVAECVLFIAVPEMWVQFGSTGAIHAQPQSNAMSAAGVVTPNLQAMKWMLDKLMNDRIDPLIETLQNYICVNKDKYPVYHNKCACDNTNTQPTKRTNFVQGLYDKEPGRCCTWDQLKIS